MPYNAPSTSYMEPVPLCKAPVSPFFSRFGAGTTILTLADADVLADGEDTLVNVNIVDQERTEKVSWGLEGCQPWLRDDW